MREQKAGVRRVVLIGGRLALAMVATLLLGSVARAESESYGAWSVIAASDKADLVAYTALDSGEFLGYRCFGKLGRCIHVVNFGTQCEDGKKYPALVDTTDSALGMDFLCSKNGATYELIPDFSQFHTLLGASKGHIGFALPLASGLFKVVRFNLDGAGVAMARAEHATPVADSVEYK
jgi:hypothetical protein